MNTQWRGGKDYRKGRTESRSFRLAPIAQAIALVLAAGGIAGQAHAAPAFSPAWFANKGAVQNTARTTGMVNGKPVSSLTSPTGQQQQANAQLQQSIANLGLAAQGIAAQQAVQAARRQAELGNPSAIPNGLGAGGLDIGSLASSWVNANGPTQSTDANGKTVVDIQQTADKAIANWKTFNVGKNTTVQFDQASADWAILNRIANSMAPSEIQGQIRAPGTVLIVNKNGIVFSGSSQINTRNLVAAAADIGDSQFTTSGIYSAQASGAYLPSFTNATGSLIVEAGAQINTATSTSATRGGGYALLLGKDVTNAGSITTPGGQVELAAGDFFIVRAGQSTTTNQFSTTHGNEVAPQVNAGSAAGNVTNSGLLTATEGDVTLAGRTVVQDGVAVATTSVNTRGTIHLLTSTSDAASSVTTTSRGLNAILLDNNGDTALDSQRAALISASALQDIARRAAVLGVFDNLSTQDDREDQSRVEIVSGGSVNFNSGSTTLATGGQIAVSAGNTAGRTTVANGATLDVSGAVGVTVAMASNNILVNVQGNEQRDAPLNRDTTNLNSSNVWIDKNDLIFVPAGTGGDTSDRWYTAGGLLEVSGYLGLAGHSIGEWAAQGGSVQFGGSEVITQTGSKINLSGGSLNVQTGMMKQTWLKGADGRLYSVDDAPGDVVFTGIYKGFEALHPRWGADATEYFYNPLIAAQQHLANGYTTGRDAGRLIVATNSAVLEGDVTADTYQGPQQNQKASIALDGYNQSQKAAAQGAQLILGNYTSAANIDPNHGAIGVFYNLTPTFNDVVFTDDYTAIADALQNGTALPQDRKDTFYLNSDKLNGFGLGSIFAAANDSVVVNGALTVTPGGSIDLYAPQVAINANLTARSGEIGLGDVLRSVAPNNGATGDISLPTPAGKDARVTIAKNITLDARGLWSNLQLDANDFSGLPYMDGGTIAIRSTGSVLLDTGSVVDVSSGAALMQNGSLQGGKGGDVTLAAGALIDAQSARLQLLGGVRAYGVTGGGTLNIESGTAIGIDGQSLSRNNILQAGEASWIGLNLAQDYTVAAGERIPVDFSVIANVFAPGLSVPITSNSKRTAFTTGAADWRVPAGLQVMLVNTNVAVPPNTLIPAGTTLVEIDNIPAGFVVPADVFPNGIPALGPVATNYLAGTVAAVPLVITAGTAIAAGATFARAVAVKPVETLDSKLFSSGFSRYVVNGLNGVAVADGAAVNVVMPVYRMVGSAAAPAAGADPSQALQLWTPPLYQEDAVHGRLTQRAGASLTLIAGASDGPAATTVWSPLSVGHDASITVDPGSAIALLGNGGQVTIDGVLNAWGGSIDISSAANGTAVALGYTPFPTRSIWIGADAVLDAAARAVVAQDMQGRAYGIAPDGGSITMGLSDAFLIVRPGAVFDASGSAATIDLSAGSNPNAPAQPLMLAGDGGSIALQSYIGIFNDGDVRAHGGGAGAAGGSLTVDVENRPPLPGSVPPIQAILPTDYTFTLLQNRRASGLADGLLPMQADANMVVGKTELSAQQVQQGGFDSLTLGTEGAFVFEGDLDLSVARSLNLRMTSGSGVLGVSDLTPHAQARLSAPYIRLDGSPSGTQWANGVAGADNTLTFSADLIDLYGIIAIGNTSQRTATGVVIGGHAGFGTLSLDSTGDVRLGNTSVNSGGDILVDAAQLYPMSGDIGALGAGKFQDPISNRGSVNPDSLLQIRSNGQPAPVPDSVFGQLNLIGGTVDQGGVVQAPLGIISINDALITNPGVHFAGSKTILRSGSLTSVSADGLVMPFGGTVDGLTYRGTDGAGNTDTTFYTQGTTQINRPTGRIDGSVQQELPQGIMIGGNSLIGEAGAVLDLSGGGDLKGAGFISGRGGSVNVLTTPLVNANPVVNKYSNAGDQVYAIVPDRASDYAPMIVDNGAGDPAIGRQIEIGANVPGLPAGTYTLLPASYALMPGAWRVEIGQEISAVGPSTVAVRGGSWITSGTLKTANTTIRDALPSQLILSPGATVRDDSQYNEMSYADFAVSQAARFGNVRPRLPEDGKILRLNFTQDDNAQPLQFDGLAKFSGTDDGIAGQLVVNGDTPIDITAAGAAAVPGTISLAANDLNAFGADSLLVGGAILYSNGATTGSDGARLFFNGGGTVHVGAGADLKAGQIFLIGDVTIDGGATLDTRGFNAPSADSSLGFVYGNADDSTSSTGVLALANGWLDFLPAKGNGRISVADGANLLTEGTIVFAAPDGLDLGNVNLGARYLTVSQDQINIGDSSAIATAQAAGVLPAGWQLSQATLDKLLHPSSDSGVPALERLSLTAGGAFNFFGSVTLDTGDSNAQLIFNTPAFYGLGSSTDVVRVVTGTLVWNGVTTGSGSVANVNTGAVDDPFVSVAPTPIVAGGPGTGSSRLVIDANTVVFGYDAMSRPQTQATLDRVALGFGAVEIDAAASITTNSKGTLSVAQSRDVNGHLQGGSLTMNTPLLTGAAGSVMSYISSGAIQVALPTGAAPDDTSATSTLGASITLQGPSVMLDTAVALPSGKLTITADGNIGLGDNAHIDMAGRGVAFFDVTKYSWGGDVSLQSDNGSILQSAGSTLDVSATNNAAGSLSALAKNGAVTLEGDLRGGSADGFDSGRLTLQTQQLGIAEFAALNNRLNNGGFFGARDFSIGQGNLIVGDGVRAHEVSISVDGGSLTVNGAIDASGGNAGSISLAASGDLLLAGTALLDTHGSVLAIDSDGVPIDASNRAHITLTSTAGLVTLADGARMDLRSGDSIARGQLDINAPRLGGAASLPLPAVSDSAGNGANDIAINAGGTLHIRGAASIAVNGFRPYVPAGGVIDQAYLDGVDIDSRNFIDAAGSNSSFQTRLAGLTAYGNAYHLRPGVELRSDGDLSTQGDLDLSGYRYGPNANPGQRGSGEPGVLVLRAAGNLNINGSISDGFAAPGATPDDAGWGVLLPQGVLSAPVPITTAGVVLAGGGQSTLPSSTSFNVDFVFSDDPSIFGPSVSFIPGVVIPNKASVSAISFFSTAVTTAPIYAADGITVMFPAGATIAAGTNLSNVVLGRGFNIGNSFPTLSSIDIPAGTRFDSLFFSNIDPANIYLSVDTPVPVGAILPANTTATYVGSNFIPSRPTAPDGTQGRMYANAPMLDPGMQSWSMRLVGGADLGSADSRALQSAHSLAGSGNVVLNDPHAAGMTLAPGMQTEALSVVRTGTGDLEILAGGDYRQDSLFGVYTAGTAIDAAQSASYNLPTALQPDGTVLTVSNAAYEATLNNQRMWFAVQGGDVTLSAQGNISGHQDANSLSIGDWLLRQGGDGIGQQTAWGINFGGYTFTPAAGGGGNGVLSQSGFSGVGALGGGTLNVHAGGDIGVAGNSHAGMVFAEAGSGRVVDGADGSKTVVQTGGGDLMVSAGGQISDGLIVNLRGDTGLKAGSVGRVAPTAYGTAFDADPRQLDNHTAYSAANVGGVGFAPGDGTVTVNTLGDLVLGDLIDPGRVVLGAETQGSDGIVTASAASWFTLWRDGTAVNAFSAGGNVTPIGDRDSSTAAVATGLLPPILRVAAAGGSVYVNATDLSDFQMPSPQGQMELLANGMISGYVSGSLSTVGLLGTSLSSMATPLHAAWRLTDGTILPDSSVVTLGSNYWGNAAKPIDGVIYNGIGGNGTLGAGGDLFMFGPNTVTDDSAVGTGTVSHIYALEGDVVGMAFGRIQSLDGPVGKVIYYDASKPMRILAGGDIVNTSGLFVHDAPTDVSMIAAGGSVIQADFTIVGPGTLEVSAGKQVYQGNTANLVSQGPIESGDARPGASIVVQAGLGAGTPGVGASDFTGFANLYLNPANLADPSRPLADQPGKVVKTYDAELIGWLGELYGFTGTAAQALTYFDSLDSAQQRIFVRQVYYAELTAGGREFNDPASQRFNSYLRGRDAIAALFPQQDAAGNAIVRDGGLTLFQGSLNAGIRTIAGGDIQTLTPGGQTVIGVDGVLPASAPGSTPPGLLTQGDGNIQMYSEGSILLGLSRVMTTFGGDILGWSAEGDINAGRGSKTTIVFTPPKREYDEFGNVKISPNVPSTGAGIATLAPIPEVPAGDVDLIAPLGTIDAGEAGIRVSGNVNLAALRVVNAANIEVKGKSTGLPQLASVNVGALINASAAATQAAVAAQDVVQRERTAARQALPSIITVHVLGFGNEPAEGNDKPSSSPPITQSSAAPRYDPSHLVQLVGLGRDFDPQQLTRLTDDERRRLQRGR